MVHSWISPCPHSGSGSKSTLGFGYCQRGNPSICQFTPPPLPHCTPVGCTAPAKETIVAQQYDAAPDLTIDLDTAYGASLRTSKGDITWEL